MEGFPALGPLRAGFLTRSELVFILGCGSQRKAERLSPGTGVKRLPGGSLLGNIGRLILSPGLSVTHIITGLLLAHGT